MIIIIAIKVIIRSKSYQVYKILKIRIFIFQSLKLKTSISTMQNLQVNIVFGKKANILVNIKISKTLILLTKSYFRLLIYSFISYQSVYNNISIFWHFNNRLFYRFISILQQTQILRLSKSQFFCKNKYKIIKIIYYSSLTLYIQV